MKKITKYGIITLFLLTMVTIGIATTTNIQIDKSVQIDEKVAQASIDKGITIADDIVERGVEELTQDTIQKLKVDCIKEILRLERQGDIAGLQSALTQLKKIRLTESIEQI